MIFMGKIYCVANMQKRHKADVKGLEAEANREYDDENKYKSDVDLSRTHLNHYFVKSDDWQKSIDEVLDNNNITARKGAVTLITTVYSASEEWFRNKSRDEILEYYETCLEFEKQKGEVINAVVHFDEGGNPHLQCATVPVIDVPVTECSPVLDENGEKVKYKSGKVKYDYQNVYDDNGELVTRKALNAKRVFGNRKTMSAMQTAFYEQCGKQFGMERGEIRIDSDEIVRHKSEAKFKKEANEKKEAELYEQEQELQIEDFALSQRHKRLDDRETRLKAQIDVLNEERKEFTLYKEKWQEKANNELEELKKQLNATAKANYEAQVEKINEWARNYKNQLEQEYQQRDDEREAQFNVRVEAAAKRRLDAAQRDQEQEQSRNRQIPDISDIHW